jgi:hypothetical protein
VTLRGHRLVGAVLGAIGAAGIADDFARPAALAQAAAEKNDLQRRLRDSIGSRHLLVLRGEGFLKMREYPRRALDLMDGLAEELGIWLYPNLRLHNGTRLARAATGPR